MKRRNTVEPLHCGHLGDLVKCSYSSFYGFMYVEKAYLGHSKVSHNTVGVLIIGLSSKRDSMHCI